MFIAPNTPAVVVNLDQVDRNIESMVQSLSAHGISHRPHIKTHKSLYFARLQMELGAVGVTCARIGELETMIHGGVRNVLLAYPVIGNDKLRQLGNLLRYADIICAVNSMEGAKALSLLGNHVRKISVLIEVDGGTHRGGLAPYEPTLAFANDLKDLSGIQVIGLMYYGGTASSCHSREELEQVAKKEREELCGTAELLKQNGFDMQVLSGGSSYSSKMPELLDGITESRAGTYIFNDCMQMSLGMATEQECALRVHSTVVCVVDEHHLIIDAGSKSLASDLCANRPGHGFVCELPDATITHLNEEHGFVETKTPHGKRIGDIVTVIPNHCCTVVNLFGTLVGTRNGDYYSTITVDARGK
ncbi:alanine racemase [Eubacteriales bacterium OttesenSCG-928-N13]|nr:alanine racemase [Eubacteriales bacterium OttesenSCG-928-N13]